ncbi:HEAT repeat domain-containing protein [Myxococcus faecalis]|uniref:HEAT repeat domain-containing protein n=1 Tax=Myxococcus faecalis TaxID=3115646 RepID=UPI0038CFBC02
MSDDLARARREARADNLSSLRRLDAELVRAEVRWAGRTAREWLALYLEPEELEMDLEDSEDAQMHVLDAGLGMVPALLEVLEASHSEQWRDAEKLRQLTCLDLLSRVDPEPTGVVPALLFLLDAPSARVRRMTLAVMAKLRPRPTAAVLRAVFACLEDKREGEVRVRAAQVLSRLQGGIPPRVRDVALTLLGDSQVWVRRFALAVLERVTPPEAGLAVPLEEHLLLDDDNRTETLRALWVHAPERALRLLIEEAGNARERPSERSILFESGVRAISLLGTCGVKAASVVPDLLRLRNGSWAQVFIDAALDDILRAEFRGRTYPPVSGAPSSLVEALRAELPAPGNAAERPAEVLVRWAIACAGQGTEARVRMMLAATRRVMGQWDDEHPEDDGPRRGLAAVEDWVCAPTEEAALRARRASNLVPSQMSAPAAFSASWSLANGSRCIPLSGPVSLGESDTYDRALRGSLSTASRALSGPAWSNGVFGTSARAQERLSPSEVVRALHRAIQEEVLPWALGTWDPVRDVRRERIRLE